MNSEFLPQRRKARQVRNGMVHHQVAMILRSSTNHENAGSPVPGFIPSTRHAGAELAPDVIRGRHPGVGGGWIPACAGMTEQRVSSLRRSSPHGYFRRTHETHENGIPNFRAFRVSRGWNLFLWLCGGAGAACGAPTGINRRSSPMPIEYLSSCATEAI